MHLLNILLQKRVKLFIFAISATLTLITVIPLLELGIKSTFFSIDPDVVYVANALSFIKSGTIVYHDHPGIFSIVIISQMLLPIRVYVKLFLNDNFFSFIVNNYDYIFFYLRIFQSLLFLGSLYLLLISIYKFTKNILAVIISLLLLFSFMPVLYLSTSISAETLNFFLAALWIYLFEIIIRKKSVKLIYLIIFLSGLMFANRATSAIYLLSTIFIAYKIDKFKFSYLFIAVVGYLFGIFPAMQNLLIIIKRVLFFGTSSGVHGAGEGQFLNLGQYMLAINTYINRDPIFVSVVISTLISYIFFGKALKFKPVVIQVAIIFGLGTLFYAKLPLAHYQTPNYLFLLFILSKVIAKTKVHIKIIILIIMLWNVGLTYQKYYINLTTEMKQVIVLENFVEQNPAQKGEIWEWARSKHFSYVWGNDWGFVLSDYQNKGEVPIMALSKNTINSCWDNLYIQGVSLPKFLQEYTAFNDNISKIEGSQDIYIVKSDHCSTLP